MSLNVNMNPMLVSCSCCLTAVCLFQALVPCHEGPHRASSQWGGVYPQQAEGRGRPQTCRVWGQLMCGTVFVLVLLLCTYVLVIYEPQKESDCKNMLLEVMKNKKICKGRCWHFLTTPFLVLPPSVQLRSVCSRSERGREDVRSPDQCRQAQRSRDRQPAETEDPQHLD